MITAAYAGLLGLVFLGLTVRVVRRRGAVKAALGDGGDVVLERRIRAHGNFAEFVPLVLVLMTLLELQSVSVWILHLVGACLLVGRVIHGLNISRYRGTCKTVGDTPADTNQKRNKQNTN